MTNAIKPNGSIVVVELDPADLLGKPVYDRQGNKSSRTEFLMAHVIQGLAFASLLMHAKRWMRPFGASSVEFKDGKYVVTFADTIETLPKLSDVGE